MSGGLKGVLKRWRENYYCSQMLAYSSKPLQMVSSKLAVEITRKVRKNAVTVRLPNGKKMKIARNSGIGIASLLFWHGLDGYEAETSRTLRFLFERATTFIDVGANFGYYSLMGALWNPNLQVTAFEPVPSIFEALTRNVALNRLQDRVLCENVALSHESGIATFFLPKSEGHDLESTGTLVVDSWQSKQGSPRSQVKTVRFDEFESTHPMRVDLVKIDVEDFEADVLNGMREVLVRDRPFIVCEVLPRAHKNQRTTEIVEALNYQAYWITPAGYIKVPTFAFSRRKYLDFLLSPVSTSDAVLDDLDVLWNSREESRLALKLHSSVVSPNG